MPIKITPIVFNETSVFSEVSTHISDSDFPGIVTPGEIIFSSGADLITGHGTYRVEASVESAETIKVNAEDDQQTTATASSSLPMRASLAGRRKAVNKLVYVEPPTARYSGNVGDTVVGRIVEVEQRRWRVDVNSYHLAILSLANVKLPTGELRRKSEDDERAMRSFMREGDLIVAEVREVFRDGSLQLHMPGEKTGRLGEGCLLPLSPSLIRHQKIHRHNLSIPSGVSESADHMQRTSVPIGLILGCNGLVWVGPARGMNLGAHLGATITGDRVHASSVEERLAVVRVRNIVLALGACGLPVWETSVLAGCEISFLEEMETLGTGGGEEEEMAEEVALTRFLLPEHQKRLAELVTAKLSAS